MTVPIGTDELDSLVAATSEHSAVDAKPALQDTATADRLERAENEVVRGGAAESFSELDLERAENEVVRGGAADSFAELDPVEEFSATGDSISEALTSVTDQFRAVRSVQAPRPVRPPKGARLVGSTLAGMGDPDAFAQPPPADDGAATAENLDDQGAFIDDERTSPSGAQVPADTVEAIEAQIGDLDEIPTICVPANQITWHKLDHQAGFLLSRVDGQLSYSEIITVSGMKRPDALRTLAMLLDLKLIANRK